MLSAERRAPNPLTQRIWFAMLTVEGKPIEVQQSAFRQHEHAPRYLQISRAVTTHMLTIWIFDVVQDNTLYYSMPTSESIATWI